MTDTTRRFVRRSQRRFSYDYADHGGAQGTIVLDGGAMPPGVNVVGYVIDQPVGFSSTGGHAKVTLSLEDVGDLQPEMPAAIYSGVVKDAGFGGGGNGVLVTSTNATGLPAPVTTTEARSVVLTIADEDVLPGARLDLDLIFDEA